MLSLGVARRVEAQSCCAGATALGPLRLAAHEDRILALRTEASAVYGSTDAQGGFVAPAHGASETDFTEELGGTFRVFDRGQVSASLPFVESRRRAPGASQTGGGPGDLSLNFRHDTLAPGERRGFPGVAWVVGASLPTGRAPEQASPPLAADATGTGAFRLRAGIAVEHARDHLLLQVSTVGTLYAPHDIDGHRVMDEPSIDVGAAAGLFDQKGDAVALSAAWSSHLGTRYDGVAAPHSSRAALRLSVSAGAAIGSTHRVQAALFSDVPATGLAFSQPLALGMGCLFVHAFE